MTPDKRRIYIPPRTVLAFLRSDAFYKGIMGPVGSGKSSGCCMDVMRRAKQQEPGPDGLRRSRFAVVRNTYQELKDTTVKTWLDWFPPGEYGSFTISTMVHHVRFEDVDMEVLFRALDRPEDVKKLLSLELTGAWVNEAREVPKSVVDTLGDRVERYPAVKDGGCTWAGVIMDTNPMDDDHWWYRLAEVEHPEHWEFFRQPGGVVERDGCFVPNPGAENLENLAPGYYARRIAGKGADHVRVYYGCEYGFVRDGKPVFYEFRDSLHVSRDILEPVRGAMLHVGLDFGLTPAAVFGQRLPNGRWLWIDELVTEDMGVARFADMLLARLDERFPGYEVRITGDPAGVQRAQTDEQSAYDILWAKGLEARPAETNSFTLRREAVAGALCRIVDGRPGLLVSPACTTLRKGMAGGYAFKRVRVSGGDRYEDRPDKGRYSHVCDAAQYLMLGGGEGRRLKGLDHGRKPLNAAFDYDPLGG